MSVLAFQKVWTLIPISVIGDVRTLLKIVEVEMGWSPKILLSMSIITFRPFMLFVDVWTKTCLIWVYHEFFDAHSLFVLIQIAWEFSICHQISYSDAFFCTEWQRVYLLFLLIQRLYPIHQVICNERMQFIRWWQFSVHNDERSIEICGAVHLQLIRKRIPWEPVSVTLQK